VILLGIGKKKKRWLPSPGKKSNGGPVGKKGGRGVGIGDESMVGGAPRRPRAKKYTI